MRKEREILTFFLNWYNCRGDQLAAKGAIFLIIGDPPKLNEPLFVLTFFLIKMYEFLFHKF